MCAAPGRHVRATPFACTLLLLVVATLHAQQAAAPFEPQVGQPGKDVVWVPSPEETVEKMLDVAQVTPSDFVVDLGSGDGRNVIAAARRGARALGVEYNPDMVALSRRNAAATGVSGRAQFVEGDMFAADFSKATVLALFLLPSNMLQLRPKFLALAPGSRIVANTFGIEGWTPEVLLSIEHCTAWCTVMLYVVPARVEGVWQTPQGTLTLTQAYQAVSGTLTSPGGELPVSGLLNGAAITITAGSWQMTGHVDGPRIDGTSTVGGVSTTWAATR